MSAVPAVGTYLITDIVLHGITLCQGIGGSKHEWILVYGDRCPGLCRALWQSKHPRRRYIPLFPDCLLSHYGRGRPRLVDLRTDNKKAQTIVRAFFIFRMG